MVSAVLNTCRKKWVHPEPLTSRMNPDTLAHMLSFLDVRGQVRCKYLCKADRDGIDLEVQEAAIQGLIEGSRNITLYQLYEYSRIYNRASGQALNRNNIRSLDLSIGPTYDAWSDPKIRSVVMGRPESESLSDDLLVRMIQRFPNIKQLTVGFNEVSVLTRMRDVALQLQELEIWGHSLVDGLGEALGQCRELRFLDVFLSWRDDTLFRIDKLAALDKLERLRFSGQWISEEQLRPLAHLKLKHFDIECCEITDLAVIPNFKGLEKLRMDIKKISDERLEPLYSHEHLQDLSLRTRGRAISAAMRTRLTKIPNLKSLVIDEKRVDIPVPYHRRVVRLLRSDPMEMSMLATGVATGWLVTGGLCAFTYKTARNMLEDE